MYGEVLKQRSPLDLLDSTDKVFVKFFGGMSSSAIDKAGVDRSTHADIVCRIKPAKSSAGSVSYQRLLREFL